MHWLKILIVCGCIVPAYANVWFGIIAGADDTFLSDQSVSKNHESMWIEGVSKRVFAGYMFHFGLIRLPIAAEWSWDTFSHDIGLSAGTQSASYTLDRQWSAVVRPGIHLGDGFVYGVASVESVHIQDFLSQSGVNESESVSLFPYAHYGLGLSFMVAPQTEFMAEVRFSQAISTELYGFIRGQVNALPQETSPFSVRNTQIILGVSYEL